MTSNTDNRLDATGAAIAANPVTFRESPESSIEEMTSGAHCDLRRKHNFRGYTLNELRMRKVVNELKIGAAKDRLMLFVSPEVKNEVGAIKNYVRGFDTFMKYLDIALLAYGISRRVSRFFRKFSRHR